MKKYLGMPDIPMSKESEDYLDTKKYVTGLVRFVEECCTPMSIALQGDWGTGKTSFIRRMINQIKDNKNKILTIYFNTWQYSQFNMSDNLYYSLIQCIINDIKKACPDCKEDTDKVLNKVGSAFINFIKQLTENKYGVDIDKIIEIMNIYKQENIENIKKFKDDYENLINKVTDNNGRVIIFIDDLDRLNPSIAVELLESIKLFMDVRKCVFVFAIDYDVVVRGIRAKYGNDMDETKCRSFFDKIIQLPFKMPIDKYKVENMMKNKNLIQHFEGYTDVLSTLVEKTMGANPRTFKRIINAYELFEIIVQNSDDSYNASLLFINVILQMYSDDFYKAFYDILTPTVEFNIMEYKRFKEDNEDNEDISSVFEALDSIIEKSQKNEEDVLKDFKNMMNVTSNLVSGGNTPKRKPAIIIKRIRIYEKKFDGKNATDAIEITIKEILHKHKDKVDIIVENFPRFIAEGKVKRDGAFDHYREIDLKDLDKKIYLGVKTGFYDKINFIRNIVALIGDDIDEFEWYDIDENRYL